MSRVDLKALREMAEACRRPSTWTHQGLLEVLSQELDPVTVIAIVNYVAALELLLGQCADYMELADVFHEGRKKIRALLERGPTR